MNIVVIADTIDKIHFTFSCPNCYTKYKKNGDPYKNASRTTHRHGSNGSTENRAEYRVPHCRGKNKPAEFTIMITDETKRL